MKLNDESNIASSDDFYEELIDLHRGLTDEQSAQLNARLILLLANHIGDMEVLRAAMVAARESAVEPQAAAPTNASRGS
jgi:predicted LPLAT superfamily acyltransferase